jgi:hypothetical protein
LRVDIIRYFLGVSSIIPLTIGLYRFNKINASYYLFVFYLLLNFLNESLFIFIKNFEIINLIQNIHAAIAMIALLMTLFQWGYLMNDKESKKIITAIFIITPIFDFIIQYGRKYQIPWSLLITGFMWILMAVNLLNKKADSSSTLKFMRSKRLILLPLMITMLYFIILNILMAFLFNDHTEQLFKKMYNLVAYLDVFSYICFSIALLWAPKKQQYL